MHLPFRRFLPLLALMALLPIGPTASAAEPPAWNLIDSGPTGAPFGQKTANPHALFTMRQPTWPDRNECSLDRPGPSSAKAWEPCTFFYEASNLAVGPHLFNVRQVTPQGVVLATDAYTWDVLAPSASTELEAHAYCRQGFGETKRGVPEAFIGKTTYDVGSALYYAYRPGSTPLVTLPNTNSTRPNAYPGDPEPATYELGIQVNPTAYWALEFVKYWWFLPDFGSGPGAYQPINSKGGFGVDPALNTWAPGENVPFAAVANVLTDGPPASTGAVLAPTWTISRVGAYKAGYQWESSAYVAASLAPCLRVIPPIGVVDNGDGTLSATFAWENLAPWNINARDGLAIKAPAGGTTGGMGVNHLSVGGVVSAPAAMPTTFGANSSGVWTYTFPDPGADVAEPIVWTVGAQSASFRVAHSQIVSAVHAPAGATPFTHIDFATPQTAPVRPISQTIDAGPAPAVAVGATGGSTGSTTLKVVNRLERPRRGSFKRGQLVHLSATIRNTGSFDAINAQICDRIPNGMKFVSASGHRVKVKRNVLCWKTSRQAAGTAVRGVMTLKVVDTAKAGKRTNRVTVKAKNAKTTASSASFRVAG